MPFLRSGTSETCSPFAVSPNSKTALLIVVTTSLILTVVPAPVWLRPTGHALHAQIPSWRRYFTDSLPVFPCQRDELETGERPARDKPQGDNPMKKYFNVLLIFAPEAILGEFVGWSPSGLQANDCLLERGVGGDTACPSRRYLRGDHAA